MAPTSVPCERLGEHAVGELVDDVEEVLLGEVGRPGGDVHDPQAGLDVDDLRQARASVRRVKTSTSTPAWASEEASSRT